MALDPNWNPLEARTEESEFVAENNRIAAGSTIANRRLGSPMEGSTIRCISNHGELEVSDSRYYVDRDKPEDLERYLRQSGRICYPETNAQTLKSVPMENYLNNNIHENTFMGFDDPRSDARGISRSLWSKKPSIWIDEPGKISSSLQPRLDSIRPTGAPPYQRMGEGSSTGKRRGPLSVEQREAIAAVEESLALCKLPEETYDVPPLGSVYFQC